MIGTTKSSPAAGAHGEQRGSAVGLRRGVLGSLPVLGQSVAAVAPSIGAAAFIPLAVPTAGDGAWLAVLIATVGILAVGAAISYLAYQYRSPGALYSFVPRALGSPGVGFFMGGIVLLLGLAAGSLVFVGFGLYLSQFLAAVKVATIPIGAQLAYLDFPALAVAITLSCADIRISTRFLLICELAAVSCISLLLLLVLIHHGHIISSPILGLHGTNTHGIILGMVFFVLAFGGFESATSLGHEAHEARRTIPFALISSVVVVGVFLAVNAYVQVLGFQGTGQALVKQTAPLYALAKIAGVTWLGDIILAGVTISFFAAMMAYLNYTARMLYAMGCDGIVHRAVTRVGRRTGAPHGAVLSVGAMIAIVGTVVMASDSNQENAFGYFSTIDGYAFTLVYLLASVAALTVALRRRSRKLAIAAAAIIGGGVMVVEYYYSFVPFPPAPTRTIIIIFGGIVAALVVAYVLLRLIAPAVASRAGRVIEEEAASASDERLPIELSMPR
ncbi:MAG: APC family permease [Solirubrobacteraceae bacterium]